MTPTWQEWDHLWRSLRVPPTWATWSLLRVLAIVFREVITVRFRRIYSIALLTVVESNRRM